MSSKISYHFVEVLKVGGAQVDRVALFGAIVCPSPFFEVTPYTGVQVVCS